MVEFEPPKRRALGDAELHRAISLLGTNAEGLSRAERLIQEQALLREQDSEALANWIAQMQADGSKPAQAALAKMVLDVLPAELVQTEAPPAPESHLAPEPLFTSEIQTVTTRKTRRKRSALWSDLLAFLAHWIMVSLAVTLIGTFLQLNQSEALSSTVIGISLSFFVQVLLRSHSLHPLLRSAAIFGGWGVYWGSGLMLGGLSLIMIRGALASPVDSLWPLVGDLYQLEILVAAVIAILVSQLLPVGLHIPVYFSLALLVFGYQASTMSVFPLSLGETISAGKLAWASLATFLVASAMSVFGQPHLRFSARQTLWKLPVAVVIGMVSLSFSGEWLPYLLLLLVFTSLSISGRDLSAGPLGRMAAIAAVLPVVALPVIGYLIGPVISILITVLTIAVFDQLVRQTPLHIPSLNTSYGFYGSFQLLTWSAALISGVLGLTVVQELLLSGVSFSNVELSVFFGFAIGLAFAFLRIFAIRSQDREIRNVEFRNMNLDNLLGL